jgi:hypothetical protein
MHHLKSLRQQLLLIGKRISILSIIIFCTSLNVDKNPPTQLTSAKEYYVKAAFVFNFTQFIEWPERSFSLAKAPFIIGIAGEDPFGEFLNDIIKDETVKGHPIIIQHYHTVREAKNCHILFLSRDNSYIFLNDISLLNGRNILTISDIPDFALKGGMIGFFLENNKVRFRINLDRAKKASLSIDSKLLRLAQIVSDKED